MRLSIKEHIKRLVADIADSGFCRHIFRLRSTSSVCLMYHNIGHDPKSSDRWTLSIDKFMNQIATLEEMGFEFVAPCQLLLGSDRRCCITFDDACIGSSIAFDFLLSRQIPFTIFVPSELLGKPGFLSSKYIRDISTSSLVTIGSHTMSHPDRLDMQPAASQEAEIGGSKVSLESLVGKKIDAFSYPHGRFSSETILIAKKCGYKYCFTSALRGITKKTDAYAIPRIEIWNTDNYRIFIQKIRGSWDWLSLF